MTNDITWESLETYIVAHFKAHNKTLHEKPEPVQRYCDAPMSTYANGEPLRCGLYFPHFDLDHRAGWLVPTDNPSDVPT